MYPAALADQLRSRGFDVVSVHDPDYRHLEGPPDADVYAVGASEGRAVVTENVPDSRRLEADASSREENPPGLIFTTNRQFPRGDPATFGRLVIALESLLAAEEASKTILLKAPPQD